MSHAILTEDRDLSPPSQKQMAAAGLRTFFAIAKQWRLTTDQQRCLLGDPPRSTFFKWQAHPEAAKVGRDTIERLSYLLGIYKALQILLPAPEAADAWISKPNTAPLFGGKTALDRMLAGNVGDLMAVRQYLDARRGGWA